MLKIEARFNRTEKGSSKPLKINNKVRNPVISSNKCFIARVGTKIFKGICLSTYEF